MTTASVRLTPRTLPGLHLAVGVPSTWLVTQPDPLVAMMALEPVHGVFPTSVTVLVDGAHDQSVHDPVGAAIALLNLPLVLSVASSASGKTVDLLLCHIAGTTSVTSLQRQSVVDVGLVVVTVTAATSRWGQMAPTAREIINSVKGKT